MYRKSPQNKGQIDALPSSVGGATIEEKPLLWRVMQCVFNIMQIDVYEDMLAFVFNDIKWWIYYWSEWTI